jgi:hypothetical protein
MSKCPCIPPRYDTTITITTKQSAASDGKPHGGNDDHAIAPDRAIMQPGGWRWRPAAPLDLVIHDAAVLVLDGPSKQLRTCDNCSRIFWTSAATVGAAGAQ